MFECVKTKSVDIKKGYLGHNVNFQNTITTKLDIIFAKNNPVPTGPMQMPIFEDKLQEWYDLMNRYITIGSFLPSFTIYGITFTNCRIIGASFPTGVDFNINAINRGQTSITIEEKTPGNLSNLNDSEFVESDSQYTGSGGLAPPFNLASALNGKLTHIDNITEELSYTLGLDKQFSYQYSVTVTPNDSNANLIDFSLALAKEIVYSYVPLVDPVAAENMGGGLADGLISTAARERNFKKLKAASIKGHSSVSIDKGTGEVTYSISGNTLAHTTRYNRATHEYSHSLILEGDGTISVSEKGTIVQLKGGRSAVNGNVVTADVDDILSLKIPILSEIIPPSNVISGIPSELDSVLEGVPTRCNDLYTRFINKLNHSYQGVTPPSLKTLIPLEVNKNFNEISQEISYSVKYSNNTNLNEGGYTDAAGIITGGGRFDRMGNVLHAAALTPGFTIDRQTNISKTENGIANITEKTSFISHSEKCLYSPFSLYQQDTTGGSAFSRIEAVWNSFNVNNSLGGSVQLFKLVSKDISYNPKGKSLSYSLTYLTDKSIMFPSSTEGILGIKKMTMNTSDKLPEIMVQEYPIIQVGMLVHKSQQTNLGSRTVNLTTSLKRDTNIQSLNNFVVPNNIINHMASVARTKLLNVFIDLGFVATDIFLTECSYSFNSRRSLSMNVTAQYPQARSLDTLTIATTTTTTATPPGGGGGAGGGEPPGGGGEPPGGGGEPPGGGGEPPGGGGPLP